MKVKVLVAQSCPTLCNPMDCSLPRSSLHGISQARILEWVAISFSRLSSQPRDRSWVSCIAGRFFNIWATRETLRYTDNTTVMAESEEELKSLSMKWSSSAVQCSASGSVVSESLWPLGLYGPWNSASQNTGVDSLSLLQRIFPIQGSNPGLPLCRRILYQLSHKGSLKVKEGNEKSGLNSTFNKLTSWLLVPSLHGK